MRKIPLGDLRVGMLISTDDDPGQIGFINDIQPTTDRRGSRIHLNLMAHRLARRHTARLLVWPDEHLQFRLHDPRDYGVDQSPARE